MIGLEPTTFTLARGRPSVVSDADKGLTDGDTRACTTACTSDPENGHGTGSDAAFGRTADGALDAQLTEVADAWAGLPDAVRAGIVAMVRATGG